MNAKTVERRPAKTVEMLAGALLIAFTATVPLLSLFLLLVIVITGALVTYAYIVRHQVPLSYKEAFRFGALTAFIGGVLTVLVEYLLIKVFGYNPSIEKIRLLTEMARTLPPADALKFKDMLSIASGVPAEYSFVDLLLSMPLVGIFFAPFSGLGARLSVYILKRQARRSAPPVTRP